MAQARPVFCLQRRGFRATQRRRGRQAFKELSSTSRLIASLRNPSLGYGADVRVAIHLRIVQPLLDMTLLFLGLPLVVTRESRNVFLAMGMSMAVTVAFTLTAIGLQKLGEIELLDPALAAWAPLDDLCPAGGEAGGVAVEVNRSELFAVFPAKRSFL